MARQNPGFLIYTPPTSDIPTENTENLATSIAASGLEGWQFPDLRGRRCAQVGPTVARSVSSAPLNRPVCFMILPLTSAITDQPLTARLMLPQLSRIPPWEYSGREAGSRRKGGVLFRLWFPAFKLNTNRQGGNAFWMEVYERRSTSIRYLALLLLIFSAAIISFFNSLFLYRTVDFSFLYHLFHCWLFLKDIDLLDVDLYEMCDTEISDYTCLKCFETFLQWLS